MDDCPPLVFPPRQGVELEKGGWESPGTGTSGSLTVIWLLALSSPHRPTGVAATAPKGLAVTTWGGWGGKQLSQAASQGKQLVLT